MKITITDVIDCLLLSTINLGHWVEHHKLVNVTF